MRYASYLVALLGVFTLTSCASVSQPPPYRTAQGLTSPRQSPSEIRQLRHVVKPGETLWRIAKIYNTDIEDIVRANDIQNSTRIGIGSSILIPCNSRENVPLANFSASDDSLDFIWPAKGKILAYFRQRYRGIPSKGIDILTTPDENILASSDGQVAFEGRLAGYGATLVIEHKSGLSTVYCGHSSVSVKKGDMVKQGTVVAKSGGPRQTENKSLHFEVRKKHKPQNPLFFLSP